MPGEQFAMHARRRFRLVPAPNHPNTPLIDVSLFMVHYGPAEPSARVPVAAIPYDEQVNAKMQQRAFLLRAGQLRRKEFVLTDKVNWPVLPELASRPMAPQMTPHGVPQQMAYPTQPPIEPPAKRARHGPNQAQQTAIPAMPGMEPPVDDEEDSWRGDIFDHLTPREISMSRYRQNHEWMEEILSSPYRMGQITPMDLGLGLQGELSSLTQGIFASHGVEALGRIPDDAYVGRLDAGKAAEFRKRVEEHIESTKAEIERMRAEHVKTVAEFKHSSVVSKKEKELRLIIDHPRPEIGTVQGRTDAADAVSQAKLSSKTVEEIAKEVESSVGATIVSKLPVKRIQDGGYQPPAPEPTEPAATPAATASLSRQPSQAGSQASGLMMEEADIDMGNTAAGLLDQMHTGRSQTSTPVNNFPTPQAQPSEAQSNAPSPAQAASTAPAKSPQLSGDVSMGGTGAPAQEKQSGTASDQHDTGSGDWVVVPKGGVTPEVGTTGTPAGSAEAAAKPAAAVAKPASEAATPSLTDGGFDQNDFSSLGDLDTAGDALAGYDSPALDGSAGELGEGLDLNMDMEDSAFGDAFHGVSHGRIPGDSNGQDV